nr:DNA-directed RNA polymerase [Sphingomonas sp. CDS-1]
MLESGFSLQDDFEDASLSVGAQRFYEKQELIAKREGFDRRDDVSKLIKGAVPILGEAIRKWVGYYKDAKGRKPSGYKAIAELDADVLAYISLARIFRELPKGGLVVNIITGIGSTVQAELEGQALAERDPKAVKRFRALAEKGASDGHLMETHSHLAATADVALGWSRITQAGVGQSLLGIALLALRGIFQQATKKEGSKTGGEVAVSLTEEAVTTLNGMSEAIAFARPPFQPMLTLPRPWTSLHSGCYHDVRLSKLVPLVRTFSSEHKKLLKAAIADGSMQEVLDAVNAIQETRWAIDARVLRMVRWTKEQGLKPSKSFPATTLPEAPKKLSDEEWSAMDQAKRSATSRSRKAVKDIRAAAGVDNSVFQADLELAEFLSEHEFFCMPHSLDFRGRVYAVPHFNHQRSDHLKALFHFADGVPLGPDGGEWLMIHLANCGDFGKASKKPFAERIAWVRENEADVLMCARYPEEAYDYWSKADSPFCFLQACFEYEAWMRSGFSPDFLSTIAIAADGSCSGLQHYSAITRSAQEAHHVNLTPRDTVGDIYQVVADEAVPTLQASASGGCDLSSLVLSNGFGRSEVKRNVMTYFYGSARFGMRDQHMEDTMRPLADKVSMGELDKHPYAVLTERTDKETGESTWQLDGGYSCAHVMASHTYAAVVSVAPKADEAASWIQHVAATLAHESLSLIWRTATGFPVVHRYSQYLSKEVSFWLYNRRVLSPEGHDKVAGDGSVLRRIQVLVRVAPTKRVEKKRMRSASSPNVIHSMDGAHLQRSVAMAHKEGIRHFAMIHDSFGTHAGNMAQFSRIIREAFIRCYAEYCPLEELDRYARGVLSEEGAEKLQPLPEKGDLDLNCIRESLYAFA